MTSSSESRVLRGTAVLSPLATPELRQGAWTRYGASSDVLGDAVTEQVLDGIIMLMDRIQSGRGHSQLRLKREELIHTATSEE